MYKIQVLNEIAQQGLQRFSASLYQVSEQQAEPDALLLRSHELHQQPIASSVLAIARAGVGVNNIPIAAMSQAGIPVFNAPGANANAVKELVLAGLLLACRNICQGWLFARELAGDHDHFNQQVEAGKKQFAGYELPGRTLGIIGLGAVGVAVANAAASLGMRVIGYDPAITVERAWQLSANVQQATSLQEVIKAADFLTVHVPLIEATRAMIGVEQLAAMKSNAVLLNFARAEIIDEKAVVSALDASQLYAYINDFPSTLLQAHPRVICLPHLGASTVEAEENCAVMVIDNLRSYLELGNIHCSVNFPDVTLSTQPGARLCIANLNIPNMVGQISAQLAKQGVNIIELANKSRGDFAYTLLAINCELEQEVIATLNQIDGVLRVRQVVV